MKHFQIRNIIYMYLSRVNYIPCEYLLSECQNMTNRLFQAKLSFTGRLSVMCTWYHALMPLGGIYRKWEYFRVGHIECTHTHTRRQEGKLGCNSNFRL